MLTFSGIHIRALFKQQTFPQKLSLDNIHSFGEISYNEALRQVTKILTQKQLASTMARNTARRNSDDDAQHIAVAKLDVIEEIMEELNRIR